MSTFGIDGCRSGWVVASAANFEEPPSFAVVARFSEVVRTVLSSGSVGLVDIPIGLSDSPRACDVAARALLGAPRASSVFTPPSRRALSADRDEMRAANIEATGKSLSEQSLAIVPKIKEVDDLMTRELQRSIREVHPEVVFASLSANGTGLLTSKRTLEGQEERLRLLPPVFAEAVRGGHHELRGAQVDDLIDALAALTAAIRMCWGQGRRLPSQGEERDEKGLIMEMNY